MQPLYLSQPVREGLGAGLKPGGTTLTERILQLAPPPSGGVVLDAGCGTGQSLSLVRNHHDGPVIGIDLEHGLLRGAVATGPVARADLAHLPVAEKSVSFILCECVWNLTDKQRVLAEFHRVTRPGATLAITDIHTRNAAGAAKTSWPVSCCFAAATDLDTVRAQVTAAGFSVTILEDHSPLLKQTAAEFVFRHGSLHGFWQAVTGDPNLATAACEAASLSRPGLFLLLATRNS